MLGHRRCFNGLLIGQGTAGTVEKSWMLSASVSMASSSAKALPGQDLQGLVAYCRCFNGLLIGQGTAGMGSGTQCVVLMPSFNGLLIGQGTAGSADKKTMTA